MSALKPTQHWSRQEQLQGISEQTFDVLVIGGGATGAGVFLDAISRGLKVALVDQQDFTEGTSSRSTKLVHGGVRYLEQAVKQLDIGKYQLVREALAERRRMLEMAPHLAWKLNLVTPVKGWFGLPYFRIGLGVYDLLSGSQKIGPSRIESKATLKAICPDLDIDPLTGGVSYFDGQFDDARYGVAMIRTGLEMGGLALNHTEVSGLLKTDGQVTGAECHDRLSGASFTVHAKAVVNCTGPWTDKVRAMADANHTPMMTVSSGVHLLVDRDLLPQGRGILIPETDDGRVLFMLPWLGKTLVGTTDDPAQLSDDPGVSESEIDYILETCNRWLSVPISRDEVTASWSGLRPLVADPDAQSTAALTRDHVVLDDAGLISLTGGKWTTWRKMAEDCVDHVLKVKGITAKPCATYDIRLVGARGDTKAAQHAIAHLPEDIRDHLWQAYGDRAGQVLAMGSEDRLVENEPYIQAEIDWILTQEGACTADDVLHRRLRVAMLDESVAEQIRQRVNERLEKLAQAA
ncbi:glycerol-3-phosphate dehydrogenase/oxidase [Reinekea blandensis]|uniref:FAD dependent oxidoreductase n=1 Tax=Reinekea blandensis MED297 TaxID=314283 RepID=A4BDD6_9GAMM|nr:FAD-dependent oxidoreductase [Reinekea blandensis]EAR09880.1 FAD dependent oxidoreductase [Reinekea sp. MED297] [Reinekea blandensis MED297]